jgi:predicted AAA+ superfamily ATPase
LIEQALGQLLGENPDEGGHCITVWAPRQAGKTWVMQQVLASLRDDAQYGSFDVAKVNSRFAHF